MITIAISQAKLHIACQPNFEAAKSRLPPAKLHRGDLAFQPAFRRDRHDGIGCGIEAIQEDVERIEVAAADRLLKSQCVQAKLGFGATEPQINVSIGAKGNGGNPWP